MTTQHTVHTDALDTLGTVIDADQHRDAIHLAVEPVVAGCYLNPGAHVSFRDGKAFPARLGQGVGIVDPFLLKPVDEGQRFWLIVYPRQITSLRHVWEHPAFPPSDVSAPTIPTWARRALESTPDSAPEPVDEEFRCSC